MIPFSDPRPVALLVGVTVNPLGGGMKGANQRFANERPEVLKLGVAQNIDHLSHQGMAELLKLSLGRLLAAVVESGRKGREGWLEHFRKSHGLMVGSGPPP